jgi:hypothetical protein
MICALRKHQQATLDIHHRMDIFTHYQIFAHLKTGRKIPTYSERVQMIGTSFRIGCIEVCLASGFA